MSPRRRTTKSKGKPSGGGGSPKKGRGGGSGSGDDAEWSQVLGDLGAIAAQQKRTAAVPGVRLAANVAASAAFLLYANSVVVCQFPYDDGSAVRKNPDVLNLGGDGVMSPFPQFWRNDFWGTPLDSAYTHKSYRPIVIQSFRIDASISSGPWIFHLTNALLYALCAWLVVEVLLPPALRAGVDADDGVRKNILLLAGLWFAAHPVHVESVAGIVGRAEILSAIFCLLGVKLGEKGSGLLGAMACFAAACLCKETAVVVPAMLGAVDILAILIAPKQKEAASSSSKSKEKNQWEKALSFISVSFGYLMFRSWLFSSAAQGGGSTLSGMLNLEDNFMQHLRPLDKLRTALYIMAKYVQLMFWPGALSCDYGLGVIEPVTSWASPEIAFVVLTGGSVLVWAFYGLFQLQRVGDAAPLLALGWAFGPLVPASHIVDIGTVMAERLVFTPTVGVAMLLCHLCGLAAVSRPKAWRSIQVALAAVCLWFGVRTLLRVPDWTESETLFSADVKSHPRGVKLLHSAAKVLVASDPDLGFEYAKRAQEVTDELSGALVDGRYATGLMEMASLKVRIEKWPDGANLTEALEYVDRVLEIGEKVPTQLGEDGYCHIYAVKATALFRTGRATNDRALFAEAIKYFEMSEGYDNAQRAGRPLYCEYATCLAQSGRKSEAYEKFQTCFFREAEEDLKLADFNNYALLMKELSGVDVEGDSQAAFAAAREWGNRAVDGISRLLARDELDKAHRRAWETVLKNVKLLTRHAAAVAKEGLVGA